MHIKKTTCLVAVFLLLFSCMVAGPEDSEKEKAEAEKKAAEEVLEVLEGLSMEREVEVDDLIERGKEYYLKGEFENSIKVFKMVLQKDPENEIAQRYLVKAEKDLQRIEDKKVLREERAERRVRRIEAQKERQARVHIERGERYYKSRNLELAVKEFGKALSIHPENRKAQDRMAEVQHELKSEKTEAANEDKASELIEQGVEYFRQGEYDKAISEWEKVLTLVPPTHPDYDRAEDSIAGAQIYRIRQEEREAVGGKDISERSTVVGITESWARPEKKKAEVVEEVASVEEVLVPTELDEKARQIVSVRFDNAHIRSVLRYLSEVSNVNIVLDESVFPRGESGEGAGTSPRVTIDLKDLPLIEALSVILRAKNLVYRLERNLIWITTAGNMAREGLITKVYALLTAATRGVQFEKPEYLESEDDRDEGERLLGYRDEEEDEEGLAPKAVSTETVVDTLRDAVPWPSGSFINFDRRTGTLVVRNTPTNLGVLEDLIREVEGAPMQTSIQAKFISVEQNDLWQLGVEYPYLRVALGANSTLDVERNATRGVYLPHEGMAENFSEGEGLTLSYTKLNPTEFSVLLDAIEKTGSSKLLSAPQVMTRNQQEAVIKVVKEYRFPEDDSYEEFYYIYWADLDGDGYDEPHQGVTLIPTTFGEVEELGIIMTVTPDIGADMKTVTLSIVPEVKRLGEWVTYETILPVEGTVTSYIAIATVHSQKIDTQIVVGDGETIVLGGLVEEEEDMEVKKVPLLGDIPLLGRFFRRDAKVSAKKSLLIFITTHLVKPTGERYRQ